MKKQDDSQSLTGYVAPSEWQISKLKVSAMGLPLIMIAAAIMMVLFSVVNATGILVLIVLPATLFFIGALVSILTSSAKYEISESEIKAVFSAKRKYLDLSNAIDLRSNVN